MEVFDGCEVKEEAHGDGEKSLQNGKRNGNAEKGVPDLRGGRGVDEKVDNGVEEGKREVEKEVEEGAHKVKD